MDEERGAALDRLLRLAMTGFYDIKCVGVVGNIVGVCGGVFLVCLPEAYF